MLAKKLLGISSPGTPVELSYVEYFGTSNDIASGQTATVNMGIGSAAANRYVAIAVNYRSSTQPSGYPSITVGGVPTTIVASQPILSSSYCFIVITNSPVSVGTAADIVITNSNAICTRYQLFTYRVIPSAESIFVLDNNFQSLGTTGTLNFDFSTTMTPFAKGIHISNTPNTATINNATGDMTYDVTTQSIDTGYARVGSINYAGVYSVSYVSGSYTLNAVAVVFK